jgi:hypothetical protein
MLSSPPQKSGVFDPAHTQLRVQPFVGSDDLSFPWNVRAALRVVGLGSTAPADRHPAIRFRRMVLIKSGAYGCGFKRDHDAPHRRLIWLTPSRKDCRELGLSTFRPSLHPTSHSHPGLNVRSVVLTGHPDCGHIWPDSRPKGLTPGSDTLSPLIGGTSNWWDQRNPPHFGPRQSDRFTSRVACPRRLSVNPLRRR